jgi:trimethylguanosine synthase
VKSDAAAHPDYNLSSIQPIHGAEMFKLSRRITSNIAYYLPRNTKLDEISALLDPGDEEHVEEEAEGEKVEEKGRDKEMVEVEEEWMGTKLKALTCYFGGLVGGQEHLFE